LEQHFFEYRDCLQYTHGFADSLIAKGLVLKALLLGENMGSAFTLPSRYN